MRKFSTLDIPLFYVYYAEQIYQSQELGNRYDYADDFDDEATKQEYARLIGRASLELHKCGFNPYYDYRDLSTYEEYLAEGIITERYRLGQSS